MSTTLNPYISFRDNAREAMTFYQSVFGGELTVNTFEEYEASDDPAEKDKLMHSQLMTPTGLTLMGADTPNAMEYDAGARISLSLSSDDEAELRRYWDELTGSGTVVMPLEQAPWGDYFGMCQDRYGVTWLVNISPS